MTPRIRELEEAETKARDRGHFGKVSMISSCIEGYKLCLEDVESVLKRAEDLEQFVRGYLEALPNFTGQEIVDGFRDALAQFKRE